MNKAIKVHGSIECIAKKKAAKAKHCEERQKKIAKNANRRLQKQINVGRIVVAQEPSHIHKYEEVSGSFDAISKTFKKKCIECGHISVCGRI